jgi:type II secretion system protein N
MKKLLAAILILAALVWGLWVIAVPGSVVVRAIEDSVKSDGISLQVEGFRKGLFYNFKADGLQINKAGEGLLSVGDLRGRIDLLKLITLKVAVPFEGRIGGGTLRGDAVFERNGYGLRMDLDGAEAGELDFVRRAGLNGSGMLSGQLQMTDGRGEARFSIEEAKFDALSYSGVIVPLNFFEQARGSVLFNGGGDIEVQSISLEGPGIFARAKGSIKAGMLDMKLELMPEESVVPENLLTAVIGQYKVSRGYYVIPLRTALKGL